MFKKLLRKYMVLNGLSQEDIALALNISQQAVSDFLNSDANPQRNTREKYFKAIDGFEDFYLENTSQKQVYKPEGHIINEDDLHKKEVTVIPIKGRGGLENSFYDRLYLDKLKKEPLTIKTKSSNGSEWFKIEIEGISMDDSTEDFEGSKYSLAEGDWAYCRSIPRHNWKNKLHFNSVKAFCFFHNTRGIIFKKVKAHNIDTGEVLLTSLNPDKKQFPDFTINVAECSYICNVLRVLTDF